MQIDIRRLREDLENYYGTAGFAGIGAAFLELCEVQRADDRQLLEIARRSGFDLSRYVCDEDERWF